MSENDPRKIEHYLFHEMSESERMEFDEQLGSSDELFYVVAERENELVDQYVRNELTDELRGRFEQSMSKVPSLRAKVANSIALLELIREERSAASDTQHAGGSGDSPSFFGPKVRAYAAGGMIVLFAFASLFLFIQNRRQGEEIKRLRAELANSGGPASPDGELQREIAAAREREAGLQSQIDAEKGVTGDLTADLEGERETRQKLEVELAELQKRRSNGPKPPAKIPGMPPTIAAIILNSNGVRGPGGNMHPLDLDPATKRVSVLLTLRPDTDPNERFLVRLNGRTVAENLLVRLGSAGTKTVSITISEKDLQPGENRFTALNKAGSVVGTFILATKKD